jgi:hypothetical protein
MTNPFFNFDAFQQPQPPPSVPFSDTLPNSIFSAPPPPPKYYAPLPNNDFSFMLSRTSGREYSAPRESIEGPHPHIYCDACKDYLTRGVRYMCLNCDDYDPCAKCEGTVQHYYGQHLFVKIPSTTAAGGNDVVNSYKRKK